MFSEDTQGFEKNINPVETASYNFFDSEREKIYTEDENNNREITAKVWYPTQ